LLVLTLAGATIGSIWLYGAFVPGDRIDPWRPDADRHFAPDPAFVGRDACAGCHPEETKAWTGSHHDLAMQPATEETVLGDFEDATATHFGVTSSFFRRNGRFMVRTEGPDGKATEYPIDYVFGVTPLQQYLVSFPGGRYQVLPLCWDTRPARAGGQRWFHIYSNERIAPDDVLYWTGPNQNWNYMCAECHSTNLKKNYNLERDAYATTWSEIDVSCEACHGPGADHVTWARAVERGEKPANDGRMGLPVRLKDPDQNIWVYDKKTGNAKRRTPRRSTVLIETCARCHARRIVVNEDYVHGRPFMDAHRVRLLRPELYFADGQILDEVYVYGSFLQSKMFHHHVNCSDCHDPHSLKLRAPGNQVCHRCHLAARFDTRYHHFHEEGTPGARCVECHMPERTYMVVDPRRDHSIRVPRPDLSEKLGTPNACNKCHMDKTAAWSAAAMDKWYGTKWRKPHFAEALDEGRRRGPRAVPALVGLAAESAWPNIVRATALAMLREWPGPEATPVIRRALADADPILRHAALLALDGYPPEEVLRLAFDRLKDPVRAVRVQAANLLASVPAIMLTADRRDVLDRTIDEYVKSELSNAERPSAHLNLGVLYTRLGRWAKAEAAYRTALRLNPRFAQAYVNLADLYRSGGEDDKCREVLREALEVSPDLPEAHHALGLLLVREKKLPAALHALARAAELRPENPRFAYVYGIALNTAGRGGEGLAVLERAQARHPGNREILRALATINRDCRRLDDAIRWARKLVSVAPNDPSAGQLLRELELRRPR